MLKVANKQNNCAYPVTLYSLPSGRFMATSGVAASAERDPDSLEREDSLLLACLLELFLSHISLAGSPQYFFLHLFLFLPTATGS